MSTFQLALRRCLRYAGQMSSAFPPFSSSRTTGASWQAGTLGPDLEAFRACQDFSYPQLAQWLGVDLERLSVLAEAPRPDPLDHTFQRQCAVLGDRSGCDTFALRTLVRWVHGG